MGSFLSISRTFVFFPYFLLGHLLEAKHINCIKKGKFQILIGAAILVCTCIFFAAFFPKNALPWLLGDTSYSDMGVKVLTGGFKRGGQYLLTSAVIYGFLAMVPTGSFRLTIIGQRTLNIYLFHGFIIKTIETFVSINTLMRLSNHYISLIFFSLAICIFLGSLNAKSFAPLPFDRKILHKERKLG